MIKRSNFLQPNGLHWDVSRHQKGSSLWNLHASYAATTWHITSKLASVKLVMTKIGKKRYKIVLSYIPSEINLYLEIDKINISVSSSIDDAMMFIVDNEIMFKSYFGCGMKDLLFTQDTNMYLYTYVRVCFILFYRYEYVCMNCSCVKCLYVPTNEVQVYFLDNRGFKPLDFH